MSMVVAKASSLPPSVEPPAGEASSVFEIVFRDEETGQEIEPREYIEFVVGKDWLEEKGGSIDDVVLAKWNGNEWIEMPTTIIREDETSVNYGATLDSFSLFAVLATGRETIQEPTSIQSQEETPTGQTSAPDERGGPQWSHT